MLDFKNMSLDQLLKLVDDNFYQKITTEEQFVDYVMNVYYKACLENNAPTNFSPVLIKEIRKKDYAIFNHLKNKLVINKWPIRLFTQCKKNNNLFLPFRMISTVVHEARHIAQYYYPSKVDEYLKKYAQFTLLFPETTTEMFYNTNPLEVDAKHYTYSLLLSYPYLNKYQSHKKFFNKEFQRASGYASIYDALLKAKSIMRRCQNVPEAHQKVYTALDISCTKFLAEHGIDKEKFKATSTQLNIRKSNVNRLTNRPTEVRLVEETKKPLKLEILKKIFSDKALTHEEFINCEKILFALPVRPPAREHAYFEIVYDAFRALETRALYRHYAPKFLDFGIKAQSAPDVPTEEVDFMEEYNKIQ